MPASLAVLAARMPISRFSWTYVVILVWLVPFVLLYKSAKSLLRSSCNSSSRGFSLVLNIAVKAKKKSSNSRRWPPACRYRSLYVEASDSGTPNNGSWSGHPEQSTLAVQYVLVTHVLTLVRAISSYKNSSWTEKLARSAICNTR